MRAAELGSRREWRVAQARRHAARYIMSGAPPNVNAAMSALTPCHVVTVMCRVASEGIRAARRRHAMPPAYSRRVAAAGVVATLALYALRVVTSRVGGRERR